MSKSRATGKNQGSDRTTRFSVQEGSLDSRGEKAETSTLVALGSHVLGTWKGGLPA